MFSLFWHNWVENGCNPYPLSFHFEFWYFLVLKISTGDSIVLDLWVAIKAPPLVGHITFPTHMKCTDLFPYI